MCLDVHSNITTLVQHHPPSLNNTKHKSFVLRLEGDVEIHPGSLHGGNTFGAEQMLRNVCVISNTISI